MSKFLKKQPWRSLTFSKGITLPRLLIKIFKVYKWYQIAQSLTIVSPQSKSYLYEVLMIESSA